MPSNRASTTDGPSLGHPPQNAAQPAVEFTFDNTLDGRVADQTATATMHADARFVPAVEGHGIEPTGNAPAVTIPIPDALWQPKGTLEFRFRPSRELRYRSDEPISTVLARCPMFEMTLTENNQLTQLNLCMAHDGSLDEDEAKALATGNIFWAFLRADQWYHFALTWDASRGELDVYLNGSIQEELRLLRRRPAWPTPSNPSGDLELGGVLGAGTKDEARLAIDSVMLWPDCLSEQDVAARLNDRPNFALQGEGRWDFPGSLDLSPYQLTTIYEADFSQPLNVIHEDDLFDGDQRVRDPKGYEWVLEGTGTARVENDTCIVEAPNRERGNHLVLWNTQPFPDNVLIEWEMEPEDDTSGLAIIFFATRNLAGGSPFEPGLPKRWGHFPKYHSDQLNGYHISYWPCNWQQERGILRRTANLRKNAGFRMPAVGVDRIGGSGPGFHKVRLLKMGNRIRLEANGRMSVIYDDDGQTYGPVRTDGWIGLRQMGSAHRITYRNLRVHQVTPR